jgi:outer membrane receptor protein involved in Fe transport
LEDSKLFADVKLFDSLGYKTKEVEPRRTVDASIINRTDLLPSINIIYKLKQDELAPVNLRFNYSKTLARPSLREISPFVNFDYEFQANVRGNPDLKPVKIDNFDFRIESYFKSGDNISLSFFYKKFINHIENTFLDNAAPAIYEWVNALKSEVSGIELEGRKKIIKGLEFRSNLTFVHSKTSIVRYAIGNTPLDTISRAMFGQAPYVINGILSYSLDSIGMNMTLSYNVQGPRLSISSVNKDIPSVFELPRHLLDFKVSKNFGKHFAASISVKDILNAPIRRQYDKKFKTKDGNAVDFDKYRYGTNYQLSLTYRL